MATNIVPFLFETTEVRTTGDATNPLFCLTDVCSVLEIGNPSMVARRLDLKGISSIDTPTVGGVQRLTFINESNLYRVIFQSRKSNAQRFQCWIFEEVIPAIRKTGSYSIAPTSPSISLPPHLEAAEVATAIELIHDKLSHIDPRLAQILIDRAMQTVMPLLPSAAPEIKLSGAVEMAENLGFSVGKEQSTLGKTIARAWRDAYGSEPQEVKRECGGAMRKLKVYPSDDPIVIATIKEFYADREIS